MEAIPTLGPGNFGDVAFAGFVRFIIGKTGWRYWRAPGGVSSASLASKVRVDRVTHGSHRRPAQGLLRRLVHHNIYAFQRRHYLLKRPITLVRKDSMIAESGNDGSFRPEHSARCQRAAQPCRLNATALQPDRKSRWCNADWETAFDRESGATRSAKTQQARAGEKSPVLP
jgi:hypothetical protein